MPVLHVPQPLRSCDVAQQPGSYRSASTAPARRVTTFQDCGAGTLALLAGRTNASVPTPSPLRDSPD